MYRPETPASKFFKKARATNPPLLSRFIPEEKEICHRWMLCREFNYTTQQWLLFSDFRDYFEEAPPTEKASILPFVFFYGCQC